MVLTPLVEPQALVLAPADDAPARIGPVRLGDHRALALDVIAVVVVDDHPFAHRSTAGACPAGSRRMRRSMWSSEAPIAAARRAPTPRRLSRRPSFAAASRASSVSTCSSSR